MPRYVSDVASIAIFFAIGAGFVLAMYLVVAMLAPRNKAKEKVEPYECGEIVTGTPWVNIHIRYYIFAMLFLIFDIETVFMYPWAVIYKQLALFGLVEMIIFIVILLVGLIYPWKKGMLKWEYSTRD